MTWKTTPKPDPYNWHDWFAWYPVSDKPFSYPANYDTYTNYWLCRVQRKRLVWSSGYLYRAKPRNSSFPDAKSGAMSLGM